MAGSTCATTAVALLFVAKAGTAADAPVLVFRQVTSSAGANAKALPISAVAYKSAATVATPTQFTLTQLATPTASYSQSAWATAEKEVPVDIKEQDLDIDNGFAWIQCTMATCATAGQMGDCKYILHDPNEERAQLVSALT